MTDRTQPIVLCIASFFKGNDFIRECASKGTRVVLLTREKLLAADWAREALEDVIAIPGKTTLQAYLIAATHIASNWRISRVVALEEYDILTAAQIREHLGLPGMGTTIARRFQDKLSMRVRARYADIAQPDFVPLLHGGSIAEFVGRNEPPWILKPRIGASAMGIKKLCSQDQVWRAIQELDAREEFHERSAFHLLEQYIPGAVHHVDSLISDGRIIFSSVAQYGAPPLEIAHGGGVNISHTVQHGSYEEQSLLALNEQLLQRFGIEHGVTHAEFIRRRDRSGDIFYFLEVAARVGGAYTAETVHAATGINLWREWARIEIAPADRPYKLPPVERNYGGIAVSLARQEFPDTSHYSDPEIVYRVRKAHHVGLVLRSSSYERITSLLDQYRVRFEADFTAVAPAEESTEQYL